MTYKSHAKQPTYSDSSLLARTDIQHAKEVSKLASQVAHTHSASQHALGPLLTCLCVLQVKYKQSCDGRPQYNPLDCVSFRQTQAAAALASQVRVRCHGCNREVAETGMIRCCAQS